MGRARFYPRQPGRQFQPQWREAVRGAVRDGCRLGRDGRISATSACCSSATSGSEVALPFQPEVGGHSSRRAGTRGLRQGRLLRPSATNAGFAATWRRLTAAVYPQNVNPLPLYIARSRYQDDIECRPAELSMNRVFVPTLLAIALLVSPVISAYAAE